MTQEDVDDALDFRLTAAHRLEPSSTRVGRQIAGESLKRVTFRPQDIRKHLVEY
jgi:hypothetical protein